jgi:hypothetical protein
VAATGWILGYLDFPKAATYSGLSSGTQTVTLAYTGKSDSRATANYVSLDAFIVGISFDDINPTVTYTSGWSTATITGDWDGSHHSTDVAGSATFVFAGTFVTYVSSTNTNRGYASMSIDGTSQGTFYQYAPISGEVEYGNRYSPTPRTATYEICNS